MPGAEEKAAKHLCQTAGLISFSPRIFGGFVNQQDRSNIQAGMRAIMGMIDILAEAFEKQDYDPRNAATCELAHFIKQEISQDYGWPPELPII